MLVVLSGSTLGHKGHKKHHSKHTHEADHLPAPDSNALNPHLMIIGTQKAATTSVYNFLAHRWNANAGWHSMGVCGGHSPPATFPKEYHFFDANYHDFPGEGCAHDSACLAEKYRKAFPWKNGCSHYIDATPRYIYDTAAPERMRHMPETWKQSVRMLAILREPVQRDLSQYNMVKYFWFHKKTRQTVMGDRIKDSVCESSSPTHFPSYSSSVRCFATRWHSSMAQHGSLEATYNANSRDSRNGYPHNRLTEGMYSQQLKKYASVFGRNKLMVISFDNLVQNKGFVTSRIVSHFGLKEEHPKGHHLTKDNAYDFGSKVHTIECGTRQTLNAIFEPSVHELQAWFRETADSKPSTEPGFDFSGWNSNPASCGTMERTFLDAGVAYNETDPTNMPDIDDIPAGYDQEDEEEEGGDGDNEGPRASPSSLPATAMVPPQ